MLPMPAAAKRVKRNIPYVKTRELPCAKTPSSMAQSACVLGMQRPAAPKVAYFNVERDNAEAPEVLPISLMVPAFAAFRRATHPSCNNPVHQSFVVAAQKVMCMLCLLSWLGWTKLDWADERGVVWI